MVVDQLPVAVRRLPSRPLALVTRHMATVCDTALDGSAVRHMPLPTPPIGYAVDPTGAIAVAYTHSVAYHDRYLWHDEGKALRGCCGVALFDADGTRRWTWDAPGPIGGFAISADGEVLVTSEGELWALG
jgi:hypothetical protein